MYINVTQNEKNVSPHLIKVAFHFFFTFLNNPHLNEDPVTPLSIHHSARFGFSYLLLGLLLSLFPLLFDDLLHFRHELTSTNCKNQRSRLKGDFTRVINLTKTCVFLSFTPPL